MKYLMKIVYLVCCVAASSSASVAASDMIKPKDTIRFFASHTKYNEDHIMECMPEYTHYNLRPHQNVTIEIIFKNITIESSVDCSMLPSSQQINHKNNYRMPFHLGHSAEFIDVGYKNTELKCLFPLGYMQRPICRANIRIVEAVSNVTVPARNTILSNINIEITLNNGPVPTTRVYEQGFFNDTELFIYCINDGNNGYVSLVSRDNNGNAIGDKKENIYKITYITTTTVNLNQTYDGYEYGCLVNNLTTNSSWETVIKLKYREETVQAVDADEDNSLKIIILIMCLPMAFMMVPTAAYYCWIQRGKQTAAIKDDGQRDSHVYEEIPCAVFASRADGAIQNAVAVFDSHNSEPRPLSLDDNDYENIYDIVYEDRCRIERLLEEMQQAESDNFKRPMLPSVDTIPQQKMHSSPPPVTPATTDSLIAPCDRYLLNIDSEGYEIPDRLKFFPIQRHISEDDT